MKKNWLLLLPFLLFLAVSLVFGANLLYKRAAGHPSTLKDKPAPSVIFSGFNGGKTVSSDDYKGQVTLVNMFAAWCPPCREEHPQLLTLAKDKSLKIIGINYKDKQENALKYLAEHGNPFSIMGQDEKGRQAIEWGVYGLPETFILDKNGIIRYKFIGAITEEALAKQILPEIEKARKH